MSFRFSLAPRSALAAKTQAAGIFLATRAREMDEKHQISEKTKQAAKSVVEKTKELDRKHEMTKSTKRAFKDTSYNIHRALSTSQQSSTVLSQQPNVPSHTAEDEMIQQALERSMLEQTAGEDPSHPANLTTEEEDLIQQAIARSMNEQ